jgi:PPK2 family polyphosphate:nucleotide phosphotransferase
MKPILFDPVESPYLVPFNERYRVADARTKPIEKIPKELAVEKLKEVVAEIDELQGKLYAHDRYAVLLVFQALDAAGKDGTIRAVLTGVNPSGCHVSNFKSPSATDLDHDFLWRIYRELPERGRIGVFNRSHYEEVLVVRVHPEYLNAQKLPRELRLKDLWEERFKSIRAFERHLARSGTVIVKFWLNVSKEEQRQRLLARIDEPKGNWKFAPQDVDERQRWSDYMDAYEDVLSETSRPWAPWYAIPADHKPSMRVIVAEIVRDTLKSLDLKYPEVPGDKLEEMKTLRALIDQEGE